MKKIALIASIIATIPFLFCSCSSLFEKEVEEVELNQEEITMVVGDTTVLKVSIEPEDAENKGFEWSTSDKNIVTVDDGTLKAKNAGTAVITVESDNGEDDSCKITVTNKEITNIELNNNDTSVKVGKKIQLTAKVQPSDAPADNLKWSSSDDKIAIVNSEGYVTGVKAGVVKITCTSENGKEAICTVTVKGDEKATEATKATSAANSSINSQRISSYNSTDFIFYDSSTRKITEIEAASLTPEQVDIAINEIYARHGHIFKQDKWINYFYSMSWYTPDPTYNDTLNSIENYNVALLSKYRN